MVNTNRLLCILFLTNVALSMFEGVEEIGTSGYNGGFGSTGSFG